MAAPFTPNIPPSTIVKSKARAAPDDVAGNVRQTKEEYRKAKELEEARKLGTAPAITDEEGRDINPHIPQFISQAPWYIGATSATLKHQRPHEDRQKPWANIDDWFKRGVTDKVATKYRKGACENCGAMTHKRKDCFERPRKVGARYTGEEIAPDEHLQPKLLLGWDAKRDRWNGYDPTTHKDVIEEYQRMEEARKLVKADQIKQDLATEAEEAEEAERKADEEAAAKAAAEEAMGREEREGEEDEDKYAEGADMPGVKTDMDSRTRITVRNLRIREDTAKYLHNLDPNSAYYDPKSRSMRENPMAIVGKKPDEVAFGGENFVRFTGEVIDVNKAQLFAWEAHKKGVDVHALAEPTKLEILQQEIDGKQEGKKTGHKKAILEKYGGEEYLDAPPKEMLLSQTERYVEYDRKGKVIKGEERVVIKSKFEEDILHNNHTAVWGSYWNSGQWGYRCCHAFVKNSYCIGEVGRNSTAIVDGPSASTPATMAPERNGMEAETKSRKRTKKDCDDSSSSSDSDSGSSSSSDDDSSSSSSSGSSSSDDEEGGSGGEEKKKNSSAKTKIASKPAKRLKKEISDKKKKKKEEDDSLEAALKKQAEADRKAEKLISMGDRDRPYNKFYEFKTPTENEMEAFRLRQIRPDDPMAEFMSKKK